MQMPTPRSSSSSQEDKEKSDHIWQVHQIFSDTEGDHDFGILADVDLDLTQEEGEVRFRTYKVGFIEDLFQEG